MDQFPKNATDRLGSLRPRINWGSITTIVMMGVYNLCAQVHFQSVPATGLPYTIIITNATLNNEPIVSGTELGVFDDTLCVGATVYQGIFPVQITAWQGSPSYGLAGFTPGNSMIFKIYTQNPMGDWVEIVANSVYETGNGSFGNGAYSALSLITSVVKMGQAPPLPDDFKVRAYPNPFNSQVHFQVSGIRERELVLKIFTLTGQEVFSTFSRDYSNNCQTLTWHGQTTEGKELPSGLYLFAMLSGNLRFKGRIILQK